MVGTLCSIFSDLPACSPSFDPSSKPQRPVTLTCCMLLPCLILCCQQTHRTKPSVDLVHCRHHGNCTYTSAADRVHRQLNVLQPLEFVCGEGDADHQMHTGAAALLWTSPLSALPCDVLRCIPAQALLTLKPSYVMSWPPHARVSSSRGAASPGTCAGTTTLIRVGCLSLTLVPSYGLGQSLAASQLKCLCPGLLLKTAACCQLQCRGPCTG
jgi:hypothetical protein